ncbi:MAG TPA: hypothetical protein VIJ23_10830, partial [Mycobacterium sp.]
MGMDERVHHLAARFPDVKVHLYGKAFRPGRKLGHVNVIGSDLGELRRKASLAARWLGDGVWLDGYDLHSDVHSDVDSDVDSDVHSDVHSHDVHRDVHGIEGNAGVERLLSKDVS